MNSPSTSERLFETALELRWIGFAAPRFRRLAVACIGSPELAPPQVGLNDENTGTAKHGLSAGIGINL